MTILSSKDTDRILTNSFSLEFLRAKLTQKNNEAPVVYSGPGSVTQQSDGTLILKLYHLYESSEEFIKGVNISFGGSGLQPGQIIADHHYFDFEGTDLSGQKWTSNHIWTSGHVSFPTSGIVVTAELQQVQSLSVTNAEQAIKTTKATLYVPGKYNIPYFKSEQKEDSYGFFICELNITGRLCTLRKYDTYLEIVADLAGVTNPDKQLDLIIEGLSIATGYHLHPHLKIANYSGQHMQVIYSRTIDDRDLKLPPPIPTSHPRHAACLQVFMDKFIEVNDGDHSPLVGYWFRVLQAFSIDIENRALVLTIAIEGLLKNYYSEAGMPDKEFLKEISDAELQIKKLPIGERAQNRLLSTLGNAKSASPKNSLFALAEAKLVSKDLVKLWTKVRNKSAHAEELRFEPHERQEFIDELNGCLELFYRLLLGQINYSGEIIQYSAVGWPEAQFHTVIKSV